MFKLYKNIRTLFYLTNVASHILSARITRRARQTCSLDAIRDRSPKGNNSIAFYRHDKLQLITAIHWTKTRGPRIMFNSKSGERCPSCPHPKRSQCRNNQNCEIIYRFSIRKSNSIRAVGLIRFIPLPYLFSKTKQLVELQYLNSITI